VGELQILKTNTSGLPSEKYDSKDVLPGPNIEFLVYSLIQLYCKLNKRAMGFALWLFALTDFLFRYYLYSDRLHNPAYGLTVKFIPELHVPSIVL
jgi:hypothetical protein